MDNLWAYIDESGIGEGESVDTSHGYVFSAAGFLASSAEWDVFSQRWTESLKNAGLPDPPELHMRDMLHGRRAFEGWESEQKRLLLKTLIDHIAEAPIVGYSMTYFRGTPADWENAYSEVVLRKAYPTCGYVHCIADLAKNAAGMFLGCNERVTFVCGRNTQAGKIVQVYDALKEAEHYPARQRLGKITFGSPKDHPPLQASDLLAYEARRQVIDELQKKPARKSVVRLQANTRITFDRVDKEWLEPFYEKVLTDPRFQESRAEIDRDLRRRQRARSRNPDR